MRFIIYSHDKDGGLPIRKANRDAHIAFLKNDNGAQVLMAGPWLSDEGEMAGSLLVVECETREALSGWMARDPYAKAGLPDRVEVKPFIWAIGAPS